MLCRIERIEHKEPVPLALFPLAMPISAYERNSPLCGGLLLQQRYTVRAASGTPRGGHPLATYRDTPRSLVHYPLLVVLPECAEVVQPSLWWALLDRLLAHPIDAHVIPEITPFIASPPLQGFIRFACNALHGHHLTLAECPRSVRIIQPRPREASLHVAEH